MADNIDKEKIIIDFSHNANSAQKGVDSFNASLKQTTDNIDDQSDAFDNQEKKFVSLKTQLKEAIIEQQKLSAQYGTTSNEAIKATKAVAGIKDEIELQKDLVKSYNPDEKFRGLSQTAGIAAIALSGVKDGFTALGIESKVLDQVIGSAQAILGVTSAVSGLSDAYAILNAGKKAKIATDVVETAATEAVAVANTEATATTWSWNAALLANPIVLIVAGIVAAAAALYALNKVMNDTATAEEKARVTALQLAHAVDAQSKSFENNNAAMSKGNDHKLALLKASGANEAAIYAETKAMAEQELQLAKTYRANALLLEQKAYEANRDNPTEFTAKSLAAARENIEKAKTAVSVGYDGLIALQQDHEVAQVQLATDAAQKAKDAAEKAAKEKADKAKAKAKAEEDALKAAIQSQKDAVLAAEYEIRDAIDKAREQNINSQISAQDSELRAVGDKYFRLIEMAKEQGKSTLELEDAQLNEKNEINLKYQAIDYENKKKKADDDKAIEDLIAQNRKENQDALVSNGEKLIANVQQLAGKNKAIQKAAIIADGAVSLGKIGVNTAEAVTKDLTKGAPFSAPLVAMDIAVGATSAAASIQSTAKALAAVGGGGGGGSAPASPSVPTGVSAQPQTGFQASSENQIATSVTARNGEMPIIKAYVTAQDVTTQQNLDAHLVNQNSFGGAG